MKIFFEDKNYDIFEIINNTFFIKNNNGDKIKCRDVIEFDIECSKCHEKNHIKKIQKYHLIKEFLCKSCRTTGENNPMYGKKLSEEQKLKLSENSRGSKNSFYGKKHTEETKNKIGQKNHEHMKGDKNPMYGKLVYDIWMKKYGEEKANELLKEKSERHSIMMCGDKNPFFGKSHTEETKEKISNSLKQSDKFNETMNSIKYREKMSNRMKNRIFSDEHIRKLRLKKIEQISKNKFNGNQVSPSFNPIGCEILDRISSEKNVHIQHAMNGGEFYIKYLGYWVDGYDKNKNTIFEYNEPHHYDINGNLKEKDKRRLNEIKTHLQCKLIIYNSFNKCIEIL